MDTLEIEPEDLSAWRIPPFQRPLRTNAKVMAMAEGLKANGGQPEDDAERKHLEFKCHCCSDDVAR